MSNPQSRNEAILQNILGEDNTLTSPQSRVEELLQAILTHGEYDKNPQSRNEALLADMLEEVDTKLIPENIKKDVEIFGTVGTLEGGGDVEALSVTENGTYTAPEGTAYSPVTVDVEPDLTTKSITENGTYQAASDNVDGYSAVTVEVEPTLGTKSITQNGTYTAASEQLDGYSEVVVNVSGGGGEEVPEKDVNFIDYDGTVLYSYTAQEALALTALPANPSHAGLTAQGWNYTLAEVKTEVNSVGGATVGQMYVTDDGKTRLYCTFTEGRLSPYLCIGVNGTVEIDWGDGSATDTLTGTSIASYKSAQHFYANPGNYVITLDAKNGNYMLKGETSNSALLRTSSPPTSASLEDRVYSSAINKIELGANVSFGTCCFLGCQKMKSITIPSAITSFPASAFFGCFNLKSIVIPKGTTSIDNGGFNTNYTLSKVSIPCSVTSLINSAFLINTALRKIIIPSNVTQIDYKAFQTCNSAAIVVVPSAVSTIGSMAFAYCYGMAEFHFKATAPPTISSDTFKNVPSDCKFYVPSASLSAYQTSTNWSAYASQMIGE